MGGGGAMTLQLMNNCSEAVIDNYIPGEYQHSVYIRNGTSIMGEVCSKLMVELKKLYYIWYLTKTCHPPQLKHLLRQTSGNTNVIRVRK